MPGHRERVVHHWYDSEEFLQEERLRRPSGGVTVELDTGQVLGDRIRGNRDVVKLAEGGVAEAATCRSDDDPGVQDQSRHGSSSSSTVADPARSTVASKASSTPSRPDHLCSTAATA